jgi:anti-anti-sigma factor
MEIKRKKEQGFELLVLEGRLDAYWSDHLESELAKCIRDGIYKLRLDMSAVSYLSSAGIRVLLQSYKKLSKINGEFNLVNISENVHSVLKLSGIESLLKPLETKTPSQVTAESEIRKLETEQAAFEIYASDNTKKLACELIGNADLLLNNKLNSDTAHTIEISNDCYALGIGAFGEGYDDCKGRYGEFLALGGGVSYLPTDGTNVPDYQLAYDSFLPKINTLYSASCRGEFAYMSRFETKKDNGPISFSDLIEAGFEISGQQAIGIAAVAESAGIVGANLIKSPVLENTEDSIFSFPNIQDCISFTSEKSYIGSLVAIFGIASKQQTGELNAFLRPLGNGNLFGHFHAMVFSYEPLMKGKLDLNETIKNLFERQALQTVIHLLSDDREIVGAGESELLRGGLWISPLQSNSKV